MIKPNKHEIHINDMKLDDLIEIIITIKKYKNIDVSWRANDVDNISYQHPMDFIITVNDKSIATELKLAYT